MLFNPCTLRGLSLSNRMVMAPMTRSRATPAHVPTALMASYYGQRAGAGLIITEGTSPSPNGLGYARIPGLFDGPQMEAWKLTTAAVHDKGGKIFVQLMHTGRVAHIENLPPGAEVVGPSAGICPGEMFTDRLGMRPHSKPRVMSQADIIHVIDEHVRAARLAMEAGFDGIELHAANGYLIEQFLNPLVNLRVDAHGGDVGRRNRLAIDIARATASAIGRERVGIRLSPYGVFNGTGEFGGMEVQYLALIKALSALNLAWVHLVDHSSMGSPPVPAEFKQKLRSGFDGVFILSGGFDAASAEQALADKRADLIAFGRPFLANPDLVDRLRAGVPLNAPDMGSFYTPGSVGYTDYPLWAH